MRSVSALRCRETSIILNSEAPRAAALVRKPARREWPLKRAGSNPAAFACPLHDARYRVRRQFLPQHPAVLRERPKHRARGDLGGGQPGLDGRNRTRLVTANDGNDLPRAFLIGLRSTNGHAKPLRPELKVCYVQGREFGTAERPSKAE